MYWFSVPAILKGWIDRVLTLGYAYSDEKPYSQGIFKVRGVASKPYLLILRFSIWLLLCAGQESPFVIHHWVS